MKPVKQPPIRLGGGTLSWPHDYPAERRNVREEIARKRVEIAQLGVRLAEIDAAEQREVAG